MLWSRRSPRESLRYKDAAGRALRRRARRAAALSALLWTMATSPAFAGGIAGAEDTFVDANAVTQRSIYGLPVDAATLAELRKPGIDLGTAIWGFPLSAAENEFLDLNGRIAFADAVSHSVLPNARALETYAGAYIDQLGDGSLVIQLTELDPITIAALSDVAPPGSRRVDFVKVSFNERQLRAAMESVRPTWERHSPTIRLDTVGTDVPGNRLHVGVAAADLAEAQAVAKEVGTAVGVPIAVHAVDPSEDTICNDRDHCYSPLRPGVVIRNNTATSGGTCTMAFHILIGTDEQFMTAGHCGCAYTAIDWHHTGLGLIGNETATMTNLSTAKDMMRVQMSDAQASPLMYADSGDMGDGSLPIVNETVFASLGISNLKKSGTVSDDWTNWTSSKCNKTVYGGDTNISTIPGDSGSPIYRRFSFGGEWYITPIGVGNTAVGQFGRVRDALDYWGATVVHP